MRETISVAHPEARPLRLMLELGACRLTLSKGNPTGFVSGYYNDPSNERPCMIDTKDGLVRFWQKQIFAISGRTSGYPEFVLEVSDAVPFEFELKSGASEVFIDLGGLPVEKTSIRFNAGKMTLDFSKPNPVEMKYLDFSANAGDLMLTGLGRSNAREVMVDGSAASFRLNFSGDLVSDMKVSVSNSISGTILEIPRRANMMLRSNTVLGGTSMNGDFRQTSNGWETTEFDANQPNISIQSKITMGGLEVRTIPQ
jgi:hypothetical protein